MKPHEVMCSGIAIHTREKVYINYHSSVLFVISPLQLPCIMLTRRRLWKFVAILSIFIVICFMFRNGYVHEANLVNEAVKNSSEYSINGEERARLVWERCQLNAAHIPCNYPSRLPDKRMFPVQSKQFVMCALGKVATSNWKTLILLLHGTITPQEAENMVFPHAREYWIGDVILSRISRSKNSELRRKIEEEYYKVTFVRNPLSRILSAYRDKFTGNSTERVFKIYRTNRKKIICSNLQRILNEKPDGDTVPVEIYSFIAKEINLHCENNEHHFVSLGMFLSILIFVPQNFDNTELRDLIVNTHFQSMLSLCDHCRQRFDFIGTVESMDSDYLFLKEKLKFSGDLPKIDSTQTGVISKDEVKYMWKVLPHLLRQYVLYYLQDDAIMFGYDGFKNSLSKETFPNHYEAQKKCKG